MRHKFDPETGARYTTVELIEEVIDNHGHVESAGAQQPKQFGQRLGVRVEYWENEIRKQVKAAGGIWRPRQKLWELRYEDVVKLGLESRVIGDVLAAP